MGRVGGDCIGLTLGGEKLTHLKPSRYSFNPEVDLLVCLCMNIHTVYSHLGEVSFSYLKHKQK